MQSISEEEVRAAMKKMESGKVVSPDNIPREVWKCLGEKKVGRQTTCQTK